MEIFNKWVNVKQIVVLNKNDSLKMNILFYKLLIFNLIFFSINNNIFASF